MRWRMGQLRQAGRAPPRAAKVAPTPLPPPPLPPLPDPVDLAVAAAAAMDAEEVLAAAETTALIRRMRRLEARWCPEAAAQLYSPVEVRVPVGGSVVRSHSKHSKVQADGLDSTGHIPIDDEAEPAAGRGQTTRQEAGADSCGQRTDAGSGAEQLSAELPAAAAAAAARPVVVMVVRRPKKKKKNVAVRAPRPAARLEPRRKPDDGPASPPASPPSAPPPRPPLGDISAVAYGCAMGARFRFVGMPRPES